MIGAPAQSARVAAFFDIDGTLLPKPSLERRFFTALGRAGAIPLTNYLAWLARAARLTPHGIETLRHANKTYLSNVVPGSTTTWMGLPSFLPAAIEQAAWHASLGHAIVLVSGTLAPLANRVAAALSVKLAVRDAPARVGVSATCLDEMDGRWTGRIRGEARFGVAKARAIHHIAATQGFDLHRCYAYGDSSADRWMLNAVGRPAAVNPSPDLERTARLNDWPVLRWKPAAQRKTETAGRSPSRHAPVVSPGTESHG